MKTSYLENVLGKNQLTKQYGSKFFECRSQVLASLIYKEFLQMEGNKTKKKKKSLKPP